MFEKKIMIWKTLWTYQKPFLGKKWYFKTAHTKTCCKNFNNVCPEQIWHIVTRGLNNNFKIFKRKLNKQKKQTLPKQLLRKKYRFNKILDKK